MSGGSRNNPTVNIGDFEGFIVKTNPTHRWDENHGQMADVEVIKRQIIWTRQGGSYSDNCDDDLAHLHLDYGVIEYILNRHKQRRSKEPPQAYRIIDFLGQPQVSVITPNFLQPQELQHDIFNLYVERGEVDKILQNRKEHRFWLSQAHMSNLHVCENRILSGEILYKLLPYRKK
jgi:hypothetical protein